MKEKSILILIPARFGSSRFPGKPLATLCSTPLINHVIQRVEQLSKTRPDLDIHNCVVTDDDRIKEVVESSGGRCVLVKDETTSGTDRIKLALERHFSNKEWDLVVNVQGDEPMIDPKDLSSLVDFHLNSAYDVTTLYKIISFGAAKSSNQVKVVLNPSSGQCLYFSRSIIPFDRDESAEEGQFHGHVGVYSFRPSSLIKMSELSETVLEKRECLEQLRALESGMTIGAIETKNNLIGVDTPEDLKRVEEVLRETN